MIYLRKIKYHVTIQEKWVFPTEELVGNAPKSIGNDEIPRWKITSVRNEYDHSEHGPTCWFGQPHVEDPHAK